MMRVEILTSISMHHPNILYCLKMYVQCLMMHVEKISVRVNLKYHAVVSILFKVVTLKLNTMVFAKVDKHAVRHLGKSHVVE